MAILYSKAKFRYFYGTAPTIEDKINTWLDYNDCEIIKMNYLNDIEHTSNIYCFILYREL